MTKPVTLEQLLQPFGLHLRGVLELRPEEIAAYQLNPGKDQKPQKFTALALVGNIGSSIWPEFSHSPEYRDAQPDPLDRWSKRIALSVAREIDSIAIFPFEGPPYYPFQQWAARAEALHQSPLGLMIHPEYGLWHAWRFGLLMPHATRSGSPELPLESPCQNCQAQPCLHSCPVEAFGADGYDVDKCVSYLKQTPEAPCHQQGCQARNACPIGEKFRYEPAQHLFHLRAFLDAR